MIKQARNDNLLRAETAMSVSALTLLASFSASPQAFPHLKPCESIPPRFVLAFSLSRYRLQSLLALL